MKENELEHLAFENKWNLNTVLVLLTIAGIAIGGVSAWNNQQTQNVIQNEWQAKAEIREGVTDAQNANQDVSINKIDGQIDRLGDRVSATEKSIEEMGDRFDRMIDAITQVRDTGNELNTKLEILRTIMERIENMRINEQKTQMPSLAK